MPKLLDLWQHAALRFHLCAVAEPAVHDMSTTKAGQVPCSYSCYRIELLGVCTTSIEAVLKSGSCLVACCLAIISDVGILPLWASTV